MRRLLIVIAIALVVLVGVMVNRTLGIAEPPQTTTADAAPPGAD